MTDDQVRAELKRLNLNTKDSLRLLAESQRALGEIAEDEIGGSDSHCPDCIRKREIARKHWKGGK